MVKSWAFHCLDHYFWWFDPTFFTQIDTFFAGSYPLPAASRWVPRRLRLPDADAEASAEQAILEKLEEVESRVKRDVFWGYGTKK